MDKRYINKVVLVTGASRGIGQAICEGFAREGATVIGVARSDLDETRAKVEEAGGKFIACPGDLSSPGAQGVEKLVADAAAQAGGVIDILINNAGIIRRAKAEEFCERDWTEVLHTNLTAPFFLMQSVAKLFFASQRSTRLKIVNIASLLSFQGGILVPAYAASKHGIAGLTKALANEWASRGVNVNAIAPGYIETENTRPLREDPVRNGKILDRIPQGRWGSPSDIVGTCLFLASGHADYINGAVLNVDGGWLGR